MKISVPSDSKNSRFTTCTYLPRSIASTTGLAVCSSASAVITKTSHNFVTEADDRISAPKIVKITPSCSE